MSMAIRSPRQSALGVTWLEDFSRGRLGVVKNQGVIHESSPNFVGFDGKWARFPGAGDARIQYPRPTSKIVNSLTVGIRSKQIVDTGAQEILISQYDVGVGVEFNMRVQFSISLFAATVWNAGGSATATDTVTADDLLDEMSWVLRWSDGATVGLFRNGILVGSSAGVLAGPMAYHGVDLTIGCGAGGSRELEGCCSDPFVDTSRAWSAAEILAYHNRSMF